MAKKQFDDPLEDIDPIMEQAFSVNDTDDDDDVSYDDASKTTDPETLDISQDQEISNDISESYIDDEDDDEPVEPLFTDDDIDSEDDDEADDDETDSEEPMLNLTPDNDDQTLLEIEEVEEDDDEEDNDLDAEDDDTYSNIDEDLNFPETMDEDDSPYVAQEEMPAFPSYDASPIDQGDDSLFSMDDGDDSPISRIEFPVLEEDVAGKKIELDIFKNIPVNVSVELGRSQITLKEVYELTEGSIIELERLVGEPLDLVVNGQIIAQGEVVAIDNNYGLRVTNIVSTSEITQR